MSGLLSHVTLGDAARGTMAATTGQPARQSLATAASEKII